MGLIVPEEALEKDRTNSYTPGFKELLESQGVCLIIDGDLLVYRVGFAGQKSYFVTEDLLEFDNKKTAEHHSFDNNLDISKIEKRLTVDDTGFLEARMDGMIDNITTGVHEQIDKLLGQAKQFPYAVSNYIFLTGCDQIENFREEVDPGYKANRSPNSKPAKYQELRSFLQQKTDNTITTQGAEADDYLAQAMTDVKKVLPTFEPVIVSIDKDLDMIPGWHYNFVKKSLYYVDDYEAHKFFFMQMLMGDAADNIKGLHRVGPVKAKKLIESATVSGSPELDIQIKAWKDKAQKEYQNHFGPEAWVHKWNMNCDLLWIWRTIPDDCPYKHEEPVELKVNG